MPEKRDVTALPLRKGHWQRESRHVDVFAGVDWAAWAIGVEFHYDGDDNGSVWLSLRLGPVYVGTQVNR